MKSIRFLTSGILIAGMVCFLAGCSKSDKKADISLVEEESYRLENKLYIGSIAPLSDVKMKNVDNSWISFNDIRGENGTLVVFISNQCPYVKAWSDRLTEIGISCREKSIGVIFINSNDPKEKVKDNFKNNIKTAKALNFEFPYVVDATSEIGLSYRASKTPETFLFNAQGRLVYHGAVDDNFQDASKVKDHYLKNALEAAAIGREVVVKETEIVGCKMKYKKTF